MGRRRHVIPLLALGAVLTACHSERSLAPRSDEPRFSLSPTEGLKGRIAFHSSRDGDFDIYVMNADGSGVTQLTKNAVNEFDPIWSPDGKQIAFGRCLDVCDAVVINADGSGERVLFHDGFPRAWSPDGTRMAFSTNGEVYVMNADGTGVTQLTQGGGFPTAWSPDGRQIAFNSDRDGDNDLYVMNSDGTGITQLTNDPASDEGDHAGWSPDGKRFVFSSRRDGGDLDIFLMNSDGSGVTQLTRNFDDDDDPSWSPDGKHIAFHSTRDGGDEDVFVMNADGTGVTQLTFNDGIFDAVPVWTGGHIATPTTQVHFVANGDFGNASWFEVDPAGGFTSGSISVNRGGPTTDPQTFLSYSVFQCDPSFFCNTIREGSGLIPNGDLRSGGNSLSLSTNTTGNPNFVVSVGPTGIASADWRANGLFTQSSTGTNQITFPSFTERSQGSLSSASANATGNIAGVALSPTGSGEFGSNHQMTIDITRTNAAGLAATRLGGGVDATAQTQLSSAAGGVPLLTAGATSATATQVHFVANGDFGSLSWFTFDPAGGFTFGSLSVSRGGPTTDPQTFVSYFVFQCDQFFVCNAVRDGSGLIPNRDLSGGGNSLSLRTNTTGNPNFNTFAGPTGLVTVNWRANGLFTQSSTGTNEYSFPGFTHRSQGSVTSASANATGGIVDVPISPSGSANIGTNHQTTIDFIRSPTTGGRGPCVAPPDGLRAWWPGDGDTRDLMGRNPANGNFNVFVMRVTGSGATQLTDVPGYNARPNWSHDGRRITFTACRVTDSSCEIYVMNADGSGQTKLTDDFSADIMSVWSPDDKRIAFVSDRDGPEHIYVMNADGSNATRLTDGGADDVLPTWSPAGTRLAFQTNRDGNNEVYVINADGSNPVNLTQSPASETFPAWSPAGDKIAFQSDRAGNGEIYVMNVDGSQPTRLTNNPADDYYPAWSPTGSSIAFATNRDGNYEIYVMSPDGSGLKRVTNNPAWDADPAWATDQLLAIASAQATFAPAKVREGFSFERAGEGVFAPGAGIDDLQQLTIDAWVKHNSLPPGRVQRYVSLGNEKAVLRYDGAAGFAQLHFYMRINGELQHIRVDNVLREGVFHHVAGSYDGSVMRLYLDGVEVGNRAITGTVAPGDGLFFSSGDETLDGVLDEIEIFDRALDASAVRAIFEAGAAGQCKNGSGTRGTLARRADSSGRPQGLRKYSRSDGWTKAGKSPSS